MRFIRRLNRFPFDRAKSWGSMPHELQSLEELNDKLLSRTLVVFRKGTEGVIKYKFRTKKTLYTLKVEQGNTSAVETRIQASGQPLEIIDI